MTDDIPKPIAFQPIDLSTIYSESCSYTSERMTPMNILIPPRDNSPLGFDDTSLSQSNSNSRINSRTGSRRTDLLSPLDLFKTKSSLDVYDDFFIFQ
ncbi:hypothetical protein EHI2019_001264300 [Entamoeba histolytica]